jgi:hypothetical protein
LYLLAELFVAPRGALYDLACGESLAWKSVGALGLMERAISMRPSVKMSAAYLQKSQSMNNEYPDRGLTGYAPQNGMTVDARMFKVDSSSTIRANDDLKLQLFG